MSSIKLQSIWLITIAYVILTPPLTACTSVLPSSQDNPCELQRKCPFNPILYHNYQQCIVCTAQHLTSFPQGLDPQGLASAAEVRENNLAEINTSNFAKFSRLYYLDLSVNDITTLQDGWAENLSRLQYLYLSNNNLRSIRNTTFSGLDLLQYLHLDNNLIRMLPSQAFGRLPQLQVVHLQHNLLEILEQDAFVGLEQLRKLNLGYNLLRMLSSDSFKGLEYLNELILSGNIFSNVPVSGLASLVGLQHIRMDRNNITTLPANAFTNLTALIELTMAFNNITTLQSGWCDGLGVLQFINISHNKVENLSYDIFELCPNIVILDFSHNHIKEVPGNAFKPLQNHHALDLHDNSLTSLSPLDMANNSMVTDIRLGGNPLECDCHLSWLNDWMDSGRISRITLSPDELFLKGHYAEMNRASSPLDGQCSIPSGLSGMLIQHVPRQNFTCSTLSPPTIPLQSADPDPLTTGQYPIIITTTMKSSPMVSTMKFSRYDLMMGIIAFLAVFSLTLMIILAFTVFHKPACRWREQMYFYISDPPLPPPRYQNVGLKEVVPSPSSVSSVMDDSTSVTLLDVEIDSHDNQVKIDLDQVSNSNPEEQCQSEILENQVEPDCNFCNRKSTISSTGGRHWSVVVHSPPQELVSCLYNGAPQSCELHGHSGNCRQATELKRYHQALKREASASLAHGVILEHIRQCCSFHKSAPLHDTVPRTGKEEATAIGPRNAQSLCSDQLHVHQTSTEAKDTRVKSTEEPSCHSHDSLLGNTPSAFISKGIPSSVNQYKDSNEWSALSCLKDSLNVTQKDLQSLTITSTHHRSRSAREPRRVRKERSSRSKPQRQRSWHGNKSSVLPRCIGYDETKSYLDDQANRQMTRPPAPLPRPEATLTHRRESVQEPPETNLTQNSCTEKYTTYSELGGHNIPNDNSEHAEESVYFEPIDYFGTGLSEHEKNH